MECNTEEKLLKGIELVLDMLFLDCLNINIEIYIYEIMNTSSKGRGNEKLVYLFIHDPSKSKSCVVKTSFTYTLKCYVAGKTWLNFSIISSYNQGENDSNLYQCSNI